MDKAMLVKLKYSRPGAIEFSAELCELASQRSTRVEVACKVQGASLLRVLKIPPNSGECDLRLEVSDDYTLAMSNGLLTLAIASDTFEYIDFLMKKLSRGERIAPEICDIHVYGWKAEPYLVCELV